MFKKKSYNVQKEASKSDSASSSSTSASSNSGTMTLQKKEKIKSLNNKTSPTYQPKTYPKKSEWKKNETFESKNKTEKVVIPKPKQKLERK